MNSLQLFAVITICSFVGPPVLAAEGEAEVILTKRMDNGHLLVQIVVVP